MSVRIIFLQLILCCFPSLAFARPKRVVVWEFEGLEVQDEMLSSVAETVRTEALRLSEPLDIRVIPRVYLPVYIRYFGGDCLSLSGRCFGIEAGGTDADYQVFGDLFHLDGRYVLTLRLHETEAGKMLGILRVQSSDGAELSRRAQEEAMGFIRQSLAMDRDGQHEVVVLSSIDSPEPPRVEVVQRLHWIEDRRRELDQQFSQIRTYTERMWHQEAEKDWEELEPFLNTGDRHELLRNFVQKYDALSVRVRYWDPEKASYTRKNVALNIPKVEEARQQLVFRRTFYDARLIPAGGFDMGCRKEDCRTGESLEHPVRLTKDLYMMREEVSQDFYEFVIKDNPSAHVGPEYPVDNINWYDVIVFANQLSELEGLEACYEYPSMSAHFPGGEVVWKPDCNGWRLPTEAEWERAALGGERFAYPGSDFVGEIASGRDTGVEESQVSCLHRVNGYDLCDMSGNISEWVWDACHERSFSDIFVVDPVFNSSEKTLRKCYYMKGGSYKNSAEMLRLPSLKEVLIGAGESPRGFFTYPGDGFRLVRTIQNEES